MGTFVPKAATNTPIHRLTTGRPSHHPHATSPPAGVPDVGYVSCGHVVAGEPAGEGGRPRRHRPQVHRVAQQFGAGHLGPHHGPPGPADVGAEHPAAPAGQVTEHRAEVLVRDPDGHLVQRLQQHRAARRRPPPAGPARPRSGTRRPRSRRCAPCRRPGSPCRSTAGCLASVSPRCSWARMPFSTLGMNWVGTEPPTTLDSNSKPAPRGSGANSTWHTAYWPCPPDCLTCRPVTRAGLAMVSRIGTRTGSVSTSAPPARSRDSTTSACASPMHQSTVWWVSSVALQAQRRVRGDQLGQRLDQRVLVAAGVRDHRDGQQRLGQFPAGQQQRVVGRGHGVAGLRGAQLGQRADVAGHALLDLAQRRAERAVDVREPLVGVVALVAGAVRRCWRAAPGRSRGDR